MSRRIVVLMMAVGLCLTVPAGADVFSMPGALISVDFVPVDNIANTADTTSYGAVDYVYYMGKYEVTIAQYTEFLNAVAATDTYGLYNVYMNGEQVHPTFGIIASYECSSHIVQSGSAGSYTYSVAAEWANRPVTRVGWGDAARFTNWLHNGQGSGGTETGAYALNGAMTDAALLAVTREVNAQYMLPTEDEWYKAAYHKNDGDTGNYYPYATSSDRYPVNPSYAAVWDWNAGDSDAEYGPYNAASFIGQDYYPGRDGNGYWQSEVDFWDLSESPYGTLSQAGNVSEWTEAVGETAFPYQPARILRGANWDRGLSHTQSTYRVGYVPTDDDPLNAQKRHVGFRVVSIPAVITGDFDSDGDVDADDIDTLCANMGGDPATYDVDEDGDVDEDDLVELIETLVEWDNGVDTGIGTKAGDFNLDGVINATDLAIMKGTFGSSGIGYADGNANCDIVVNATDLAILKTNFGFTAPTGGGVPEPMTIGLLAVGACLGLLRKRR